MSKINFYVQVTYFNNRWLTPFYLDTIIDFIDFKEWCKEYELEYKVIRFS